MKKRTFDCVEMMHQAAENVKKQWEGMSLEEKADYLRKQTEEMQHRQQELIRQRKAS